MSQHLSNKHIICVGAVYIDTILTVPHFPHEDTKLRAKNLTRRRGGNTANTLEILAQLLDHDPSVPSPHQPQSAESPRTELHLVSVLPHPDSPASKFILASLPRVELAESSLFCREHEEAASSYIIQSLETLSRTIVSANALPEMTFDEFKSRIDRFSHGASGSTGTWPCWVHFEGRVPDMTLQCVCHLRRTRPAHKVSVECEKPEREGMVAVAAVADVVFYSRLWAETKGFRDARTFLEAQLGNAREGAMLCCMWGAGGATAVQKSSTGDHQWARVYAWKPHTECRVVDTIGAGDTFIAGMLFVLTSHGDWTLEQKLGFANEVAGRKVLQEGFAELGRQMWEVDTA